MGKKAAKTKKERVLTWPGKLAGKIKSGSWRTRVVVLAGLAVLAVAARLTVFNSTGRQIEYETTAVQKGTLVKSVSASGTITSGNNTAVTTKASGVVKSVAVINGDKVVKGQKIAEIAADEYAQERQTAAWVKYLEATETVKDAKTAKVTADIAMWEDRQAILDAEEEVRDINLGDHTLTERTVAEKSLEEARLEFAASEVKYTNATADIANAQAKVSSAWRDYQENSAVITAPVAGTISDLSLAAGLVLAASSATSNTSGATIVSAQTVGKITNPGGQLLATVNLTEIDIIAVKANQKVTLEIDAYGEKSFTGKVLAINTSGSVSSGVTSYPVTILLDPVTVDIYPNMAVSAQIIIEMKTDVVLVPAAAVNTVDGAATVKVLRDGQPVSVVVEVGSSNDAQTEIIAGISEGDEVVTAVISPDENTEGNETSSPFSGVRRSSSDGSSDRSTGGNLPVGGPMGF